MSIKEFGTIIEEAPKEFGQVIEEPVSRGRSLAGAFPKGVLKEAINFISSYPLGKGPIPGQFGIQAVEEALPTRQELPERLLERAGRLVPGAALGGEGLLLGIIRTGLGSLLGQGLEEAGAPEWAQTLGELSAFMAPKLSGKLQPRPAQKEAVEFLRKKGLGDKEITALLQDEKKLRRLGKFAQKGEKTREIVKGMHEKLGQGFEEFKESGRKVALPEKVLESFSTDLNQTVSKINPRFRRLIEKDIQDLYNSPMNVDNLVDFYQDVNAIVGSQQGGKAVLGMLKKPVVKAFHDIDPKIGKEFDMLNQFYGKKFQVAKALKPREMDDLLDLGKVYGISAGIAMGDIGVLKNLLGVAGGRMLSRELLINPKLQNISNQMLKSINDNKLPVTLNLMKAFKKEAEKSNAEFGEIIPEAT